MKTGKLLRGKKEIVHAHRYLLFAKQIITIGRINDYSIANSLFYEIIKKDEISKLDEAEYEKSLSRLKKEIKEIGPCDDYLLKLSKDHLFIFPRTYIYYLFKNSFQKTIWQG